MASWGAAPPAISATWQDASAPTSPSQHLEWGHLSSGYGDMLQWGEPASAAVPREVYPEPRRYQQERQVMEQQRQQQQQQQQALAGESALSTFFGDLLHRCARDEEFARTGPVLRHYLEQQQCSALNRAANFLEGNQQQLQAASMPQRTDVSNLAKGTPAPQFGSSASAWLPKSTPVQRRDAARPSAQQSRAPHAVVDHGPAGDPPAALQGPAVGGQGFSLRTILKALDHVPTGCVLMAKKFNRLGSNAVPALHAHFGNYGIVRHILVPDVNACQVRTGRRRKPANQAFVIMADAAAVDRVLGAQRKHVVQGQLVQVTRFEHHNVEASQPADGEEDPVEMADASESAETADVSLDECAAKLAGDGYDRQISSTTAGTLQLDGMLGDGNLSSSSGDDRQAGDNGAWTDGGEDSEADPCEITGDFEYWATDDEGL